ncbi:hypothetical protein ACFQFC_10715 [Amorphoplanes digitatis]|uniref:Uncharacterized protein n=1 Tax=Actinoplanes digitatis TaxID=1868 RepID=A0A7W7I1B6_9ACTN|nr:hypothetical protein [Actinoplanes digitatis]MBB4764669.1 hypothetical protein [Actinoplanes digitatis]GID91380.1 hypothetical protein Adi01nite_07920 [Actinoplanes digitatis]
MLLRRTRRSLSAVLLGALATMPLAATAHAAPDRPVTAGDMSVTLVGDRPAIASMTIRNNGDEPVQGFSVRLPQPPVPITVDGDFVNCYNAREDRPLARPAS